MDWATSTNTKDTQGSQAWHEWRNAGIGASDVPVLFEVSPWKTVYRLWQEKTNQMDQFKGNAATRRGQDLEKVARKKYEEKTLSEFPPETREYKEYPVLRCSLDGFNHELNRIIEIKCPGKSDHETAVRGIVPEKYVPQVQAQLLITGAIDLDYVSFDGTDIAIVKVIPDLEMQRQIVEKAKWFWNLVETKTPPPINEEAIQLEDVDLEIMLFEEEKIKESIKELEAKKSELSANIDKIVGGRNIICGPFKCMYVERKGSVDYKKIPQLKGVDLEQFRKQSTRYLSTARARSPKE